MSENDGINSKGRILRGDAIGQGRILAAVEGIARVLSPTNETIATISPMWANLVARFGVQGHATYFASGDSTLDSVFGMEIQGNAYKVSSSLMEVIATMDSSGVRVATSTATLPVVTTVDSDGTLVLISSADLLATFGFTSEGVYVGGGTATIDANTTLESDGTLTASGVATMAMIATLSAIPSGVVYQGTATLDVVSSLTATMWRLIRGTVDPMDAEFNMASSGNRVAGAQGTLFGEFGLEVGTTNVFKEGSANLDAVTSIAIDATASYVSGSSLENAFHLASDAFLLFNGMATLSSTFELTSEAIRVATGDSTLDTIATLDSSAVKVANGDSTLDAEFDLASNGAALINGDAQLDMLADIDALPTRIPERGYRMHYVYPHPDPTTAKYQIYTEGRGWEVTDEEWDAGDGYQYIFPFFKNITLASTYPNFTPFPDVGVYYRQPTAYMTWAAEDSVVTTLGAVNDNTWDAVWANDRWHFVITDSATPTYGLKYWRRTDSGADINATLRVKDATYDVLGRNLSLFADGNGHLHIVCYHQRISDNKYVLHHYLSTNNGTSWTEYEDSTRSYAGTSVVRPSFMGENNAIVSLARISSTSFDVIHRDPFGTWTAHTITEGGSNITGRFAHVDESGALTVIYSLGTIYKKIVWDGSWSSLVTIYDTSVRSHGTFSQFVQDMDGNLHWIENQGSTLDSRVIHHQWTGSHSENIIDTNPAGTTSISTSNWFLGLKLEQWRDFESTTTLPTEASLDATATYVTNADATLPVEATVEARGGFVIEGDPDPLNVEANVTAAGSRMILGTSAMEAYAGLTGSGIYVGKTLSTLTGEFGFSAEGEVVVSGPNFHVFAPRGTDTTYWKWNASTGWSGSTANKFSTTGTTRNPTGYLSGSWNPVAGSLEAIFSQTTNVRIADSTGTDTWSNESWATLTGNQGTQGCIAHLSDGTAVGTARVQTTTERSITFLTYNNGTTGSTTLETSHPSSGIYILVGNAPLIGVDSNDKVHIIYLNILRIGGTFKLRYATNKSGSWVIGDVPSVSGEPVPRYSFVIGDKMHFTYTEGTNIRYKILDMIAGTWTHETVGTSLTNPEPMGIWSDGVNVEIIYNHNNTVYRRVYVIGTGWNAVDTWSSSIGSITSGGYYRVTTDLWHCVYVVSGNLEHWQLDESGVTKTIISSGSYTNWNGASYPQCWG